MNVDAAPGLGDDSCMAKKVAKARTGWSKRSPRTREARRAVKAKCGTSCFLKPSGDGGAGSFPICRNLKSSRGKCVVDCQGVKAAYTRARQFGHNAVAKKALKAACKAGCGWAKRQQHCPV